MALGQLLIGIPVAQTFIGNLILRLQENVSAGAKRAASALKGLDAAAAQVGKSGSGAAKLKQQIDGITASAQRMASAPWGANVQAQFNRLGAGAKDLDKLRQSWDALQARIADGGLKGKLKSNEVAAWRQSVVGHLTAVRAQAKSTQASFAAMQRGFSNAMKPIYTAAGLGTWAYVFGRLANAGLTAASANQREVFRQQMAGMTPDEQRATMKRAGELSNSNPSVDRTDVMEMIRSARNTMGDTERGMAIAEAMTKGMVTLQSTRGVDTANDMMTRLVRGIDNLGQNESGALGIKNATDIIEGVIKATQVEGRDLDPGQLYDFARRAKVAGPGLSTEFIMNTAPAMMQDMTAHGFGAALSSAYQAFVIGAKSNSSKINIANQRELGIREGKGHGSLVNDKLFSLDPYAWVKQELIPRLIKKGVDINDSTAVTKAVADLTMNQAVSGLISRMIQQREQIDKSTGLYKGAQGLDAAKDAPRRDSFVGWEAVQASLRVLSATVLDEGTMNKVASGLTNIGGYIRSFADGLQNMSPLQKATVGGYAATAGIFGAVTVGKAVWGLITAGTALKSSAVALQGAAVALRGGAAVGPAGAAAGAAGAAGGAGAGWAARLLGVARVGAWGALAYGFYDLLSRGYEPEKGGIDTVKPGEAHNNYLKKRRKAAAAFKEEQDAQFQSALPWSETNRETQRAKAFSGLGAKTEVDTTSIDAAQNKAASAGAEILKNLGVRVAPTVETSSIDAAIAKARELVTTLQRAGSVGAAVGASIGREIRASQSDYGVAP